MKRKGWPSECPGTTSHVLQFVRLAALLGIIVSFLVIAPTAAGSHGWWNTYHAWYVSSNYQQWDSNWNNHHGNKMFHNDSPSGLGVHVMEHFTDGSWYASYGGSGNITVCHGAAYTQAACWNTSSYWEVAVCDRRMAHTC